MPENIFDVESWLKGMDIANDSADELDRRIFGAMRKVGGLQEGPGQINEVGLRRSKKEFLQELRERYPKSQKKYVLTSLSAAASIALIVLVSKPWLERGTPNHAGTVIINQSSQSFSYRQEGGNEFQARATTADAQAATEHLRSTLERQGILYLVDRTSSWYIVKFTIDNQRLSQFNQAAQDLGLRLESAGNWTVIITEE
jgi:hypothetical protein